MRRTNVIVEKTFNFSKEIIKLYSTLRNERSYDIASQVFRSATSIGANVEEAQAAQSRKDFISKMSIAAKEARETKYWLRLIKETQITKDNVSFLLSENEEIINILTSIIKTSQNPIQNS